MHKITKEVHDDKLSELIVTVAVTIGIWLITWVANRRKQRLEQLQKKKIDRVFEDMAGVPAVPAAVPPVPPKEEGERVTSDIPEATPQTSVSAEDAAAEKHRERWRRAFIDAEILNRKY